VTGAGQVSSGASATGGAGGGVGALGVSLHPEPHISANSVSKTLIVVRPWFLSADGFNINSGYWSCEAAGWQHDKTKATLRIVLPADALTNAAKQLDLLLELSNVTEQLVIGRR